MISWLWLTLGCAALVDNYTYKKVIPVGLASPDLRKACGLGESLSFPLRSFGKLPRTMVVAETTAGLCEEFEAWEARLTEAKSLKNLAGDARLAEVKDARLRAQRAHTRVATRYYRAFRELEKSYPKHTLGEGACPTIKEKDEVVYVVGLVAGLLAVLHSKNGANLASVPDSLLPRIARAATCVNAQKWWYVPHAIQGSVWAAVPGSGPEKIDPWKHLSDAADKGSSSGVRVGWGFHNLIAANAGRTKDLHFGLKAHAESKESKGAHPNWALLDEYAYYVSRHQSDLLWIAHAGHRTELFGDLPQTESESSQEEDPFGEEPTPTPAKGDPKK